uniref:Uncharacterized protein n=1 Tax=Psilocybe cubensis TaxID=181762 RepID=A0A8H8CPT3_PSICU
MCMLTIIERAQISNWFECKIANNDIKMRIKWVSFPPLAHAFTLYIAHHLKQNPRFTDLSDDRLIEEAWSAQCWERPTSKNEIDVDRDCLQLFEEEIFEVSARAGVAGHCQWGLDVGPHQDGWNPYGGLPDYFNFGDREGDDSELEWAKPCSM